MDYWFRDAGRGDGAEIPDAPALLIGIHSGAPLVWDAWMLGVQRRRHYGRTPARCTEPRTTR